MYIKRKVFKGQPSVPSVKGAIKLIMACHKLQYKEYTD